MAPQLRVGATPAAHAITRRQLAFTAGPLVASMAAACGDGASDPEPTPGQSRVAVIGAGIAGLHCAYRLQQVGVDVTVFEASGRVGGRMFTAREQYGDEQLFELGGELIDSNHATMLALAEELEIALDDRLEDPSIQTDVWFVAGEEVPEATIVEQFSAVAPAMAEASAAADDEEDDSAFVELDRTPLSDWLDEHVAPAKYPELHAILVTAYRGEFGREPAEQSALNLLYLIGSDEPDPFRIFGESDEKYHAHEGSDAFPSRLAALLSNGTLRMNEELLELRGDDAQGFTVSVRNSQTRKRSDHDFEHVVLAIPFTVLRNLQLEVPLSDTKRQIIAELGYGTNAKVMGSFESRVWRDELGKSGSATSDLPLQQVWDSSIGQPGGHGILTNFLGGDAGIAVGSSETEAYYTGLLGDLEAIFPGVSAAYRPGTARLMHWASSPYVLGSYTCYRPGQWSFWLQEGLREGNLHFCGEHTSADFQGWMEGGAETGALVAAEILADLELEPSAQLAALLDLKRVVPQPTFSHGGVAPLGYRTRKRLLAAVR